MVFPKLLNSLTAHSISMKAIVLLIPLMLILSGCVDNLSPDYLAGQADGAAGKKAQIDQLKDSVKLQAREVKGLNEELERKTEVTRDALANESESLSILRENNDRLAAIEKALGYLDSNINLRIDDLNTSIREGIKDLNLSIYDLNG